MEIARQKSDFFEAFANTSSSGLNILTQFIVFGVAAYMVVTGDLTFGNLYAITILSSQIVFPIDKIIQSINGINSASAVIEKSNEQILPLIEKSPLDNFNNNIKITNLSLRYTEDDYVVSGLNLKFEKGKKYAILAPSGYGKTSIARALALEFSEFDGTITIDGKDIKEVNTKDYNRILRYVRQDPFLFSDTALNNITFFDNLRNNKSFNKILDITRVNEFLQNDEALSRHISNTSGLSGGQKQRIVLARALLHEPKILILDEITAGVDLETACDILEDLFTDKDLTCIAITHENNERFLTNFDEIIRLS